MIVLAGKGQHVPVTGLQYHNVPNTNKFFVIATTPQRMYQFQVNLHFAEFLKILGRTSSHLMFF
jgi:hypothetical protein